MTYRKVFFALTTRGSRSARQTTWSNGSSVALAENRQESPWAPIRRALPFWFDDALQTIGMPHREVNPFSHSIIFAPLRLIHTWGGYHIVRLGPNPRFFVILLCGLQNRNLYGPGKNRALGSFRLPERQNGV